VGEVWAVAPCYHRLRISSQSRKDIPTPTVTIACTRYDRRGRYRLASLIAGHGADMPAGDLLRIVSLDCPVRRKPSPTINERRDPYFVVMLGMV
jgi:hypothetical protein